MDVERKEGESPPTAVDKTPKVVLLLEDAHALYVMAKIAMAPRQKEPFNPSWKYRESFKRVRALLQYAGRIPS